MDQDRSDDHARREVLVYLGEAASITTIEGVLTLLEKLDGALPPSDGVKWFNLLYLMVTRAISQHPSAWADPAWLNRLDVLFAQLYFGALAAWYTDRAMVPRAWRALFEVRDRQDIKRVQFALAGMNAHINYDLPTAIVQTCTAFGVAPERGSTQYRDFEAVNVILAAVEPQALQHLATGLLGTVAQDLGSLRQVLSMWSVQTARDTAWTNAELGWQVRDRPAAREHLRLVLDRMTGFAGRGLLVPVVLLPASDER